jgi:hypothetical protein
MGGGDEGPAVYIQTKKKTRENKKPKQPDPRADNPDGLSNIPPYT